MSILVEIAQKADVSVEGVVRVLTREPVSEAVLARVLAVLDDLDPDQTRAVQRFALAALHDVLPRPLDPSSGVRAELEPAPEAGDAASEGLPALTPVASPEPKQLPAARSEAALVELSGVLSELAEAVRDLRRETDAERRERVDDLAVLIDLITTGWQGLDARLGRIERQLNRLDAGRKPPTATPPALVTPALAEPVLAAVEVAPLAEPAGRRRRPVSAALTLAGVLIGTAALLQLFSGGPDVSDLVAARGASSETTATPRPAQGRSSTTGVATTTVAPTTTRAATTAPATTARARPAATRQPAPAATSSVIGTSVGQTQPRSAPPALRPKPPPSTATQPATTSGATEGFKPTRNWAWAPVPNADYYSVGFTRGGETFYRATPTEPRLTLPGSVVFRPGSYRWIVRAGFGALAAKRLGVTVVDSGFTVS